MPSLAELHESALNKYKAVRSRLESHKEVLGTAVERVFTSVGAGLGGASAAALDFYLGTSTEPVPEAMIGPVPLVMSTAFALTIGSIILQKEDWSKYVAGFANGMGAASAYAETLRFLQAQNAASAAAAPAAAAAAPAAAPAAASTGT